VQVLPIDLVEIIATTMAMLVVLIPVAGLTARFALKPLVDSFGRYLALQGQEDAIAITDRRIALLEQSVEALQGELSRVREAQDFETALRDGGEARSLPSGGVSAPAPTDD
jgi:uncharacterized protein (DUF2164 family)